MNKINYKLNKKQKEALLKIKDYFEKRLSSSNERIPYYCESAIDMLMKVYEEEEYDYATRIVLNSYRDNYYKDKGVDFNKPFGPKVTII